MIALPPVTAAEDRLQPLPRAVGDLPRPDDLPGAGARHARSPGRAPGWRPTPPPSRADVMGVVAISCVIAARDGGVRPPGAVLRRRVAEGARHGGDLRPGLRDQPVRHARERLAAAGLRRPAAARLPHLRVPGRAAPQPRAALPVQPGGQQLGRARRRHEQRPRARPRRSCRSDRATAAFIGPDGDLVARVRLDAAGRLSRSEEPSTPEDDAGCCARSSRRGQPLLMPRHTRVPEARRWLAQYEMRDAVDRPAQRAVRHRRGARRRRPARRRAHLRGGRRPAARDRGQPRQRRAAQRRAHRPAAPRRAARRAHRPAQPGAPAAPARRRARPRCPRARRPAPRSSSSTSTSSSRSTRRSGTSRATACSWRSPSGSRASWGRPAPSPGSAATSSPS